MRRIFHVAGHSAATVIRPRGGVIARSGIISSTPSNPQNDGGNFGQTINTFRLAPNGGSQSDGPTSGRTRKGAAGSVLGTCMAERCYAFLGLGSTPDFAGSCPPYAELRF